MSIGGRSVTNNKYKVSVNKRGTMFYRLNGKLHREDGPAAELYNDLRGFDSL